MGNPRGGWELLGRNGNYKIRMGTARVAWKLLGKDGNWTRMGTTRQG